MTIQPNEKYLGNFGDAIPIDYYGGYFIYVDADGRAQAEYLKVHDDGLSKENRELLTLIRNSVHQTWCLQDLPPLDMGELESLFDSLKYHFEDMLGTWTVYRFDLDQCTFIDGIISDNKFHPDHPAWFAKPESEREDRPQDTTYLQNVADCVGADVNELQEQLCSCNPVTRAAAYRNIAQYHGWDNFDQYPLTYRCRKEVELRYKSELEADKTARRSS